MITKTIQARHLHVGMELVDGGDGVRRTTHAINELHVNAVMVEAIVRNGNKYEPRKYDPREGVRVRTDS